MTTTTAAPQVVRVHVPPRTFRNELRAVKIVWKRELIRFRSDHIRIISQLVQPLPGQTLVGLQRRTGLKTLPVMLRGTRVDGGDLATWLLRLKGGPDARIDVRPGGRLGDVYTLAETPWWEQPPGT